MDEEVIEDQNEKEETNENQKASEDVEKNESIEDSMLSNVVTVEEYLMKENITLLDYERQMFIDLIHSDALIICAKGISYDKVLINFLKVCTDPGNLILIVNYSEAEEEFYKSHLDKKYVHEAANTATERERIYLEGGIHFVSTRILVVDMLKNRIPIELITGIVVLRAHTIIESCQEAFLIRLYRQKNKNGFIKALSDWAEAFTMGYNNVENIMKNLFVKELFIWPRFHALIQSSLKPYEPNTIEFHIPMTKNMIKIQSHLLDIMNYLIKDLKIINRTLDLEEVTTENCITKKFHKILQTQLDCVWHQLNSQTRLIISDLKILRHIMFSLIYSDAVSSYALIKQYRTTEYAFNNSGWVLLDSAEQLFKLSKERVYNDKDEFSPENCPKWKALSEILRVEIPNDAKINKFDSVKVLILCQDSKTCFQLNQYLTQCGEQYLLYMAMKYEIPIKKMSKEYQNLKGIPKFDSKSAGSASTSRDNNKKKSSTKQKGKLNKTSTKNVAVDEEIEALIDDNGDDDEDRNDQILEDVVEDLNMLRESYVLTASQQPNRTTIEIGDESEEKSETMNSSSYFEPFLDMENLDITSIINNATTINQPLIYIQTFKTAKEGSKSLNNTLNSIQPQYVIMYNCNVTAIRQLEVYEARLKRDANKRMKVFFLLHAQTVEEQSYLTSLRREKQAFELLINVKSSMAKNEYDRLDVAITTNLEDDSIISEEDTVNTRQAGGQKSSTAGPVEKKIIVDMREFRSDLPCILNKRGIEIVPLTISVGDYIITPEICVERKSISDLIGSLNSGRLYNQCLQMQRYYSKPFLLIEFDQNKPFHLQSKYILSNSSTSSNADILEKLQLLTLHFPKLRLIWSPNPYATAQLFEELKQDKDEPNPIVAASIGTDESTNSNDIDNYNSTIYDFMIRLPGITSKNILKVMKNGGSLKELLKKDQEELSNLLDSQINAKLLWDALHGIHKPEKPEETIKKPPPSKYKQKKARK